MAAGSPVERAVIALAAVLAALAPQAARIDTLATTVVMLGTGTPNADPERSGPAVAVLVGGRSYIVDAGPGVVRRAAAAARLGYTALAPDRLTTVFLTHLHSDHTLGLPDLIFSPWTLERTVPLKVFGPPGTLAMTNHIAMAWSEDLKVRLDGLEPANATGYKVESREVSPGLVYQDEFVAVHAFQVPHGSWPSSYGYRFVTRDKVIVISGDTGPTDVTAEQCNGCDVLVHEVYSAERFVTRPLEWQRYHSRFHVSTVELAQIAKMARPKLLVLYHQLFWGTTDSALVAEVRAAGFTGHVVSAKDLDAYP
jgi:ribonuclease BN (tRNA processing enzyme)